MNSNSSGRDLFIVDNSVSGWTGLRYLRSVQPPSGCFAGLSSSLGVKRFS